MLGKFKRKLCLLVECMKEVEKMSTEYGRKIKVWAIPKERKENFWGLQKVKKVDAVNLSHYKSHMPFTCDYYIYHYKFYKFTTGILMGFLLKLKIYYSANILGINVAELLPFAFLYNFLLNFSFKLLNFLHCFSSFAIWIILSRK